jgi:hypothetical protein
MRGGEKTCWRSIRFEAHGERASEPWPSRQERLAALYRFQMGQALSDVRLVDAGGTREVTDPAQIDWTHFPVLDALEAVTRDELHRLRSLLRTDTVSAPAGQAAQASASLTPPNGLVWGVDLRRLGRDGATASPLPIDTTRSSGDA